MIEQGTDEWFAARLGKVTASRIADIMREGRGGKPSASRARYLGELVAERLTGAPHESFQSAEMLRGNDMEASAWTAYAFETGEALAPGGFFDHPRIALSGASPDRLVGERGLLETKCPATHTHIETILTNKVDADYVKQMQWQMACAERDWCDFASYDPRMPATMQLHIIRIDRDNEAIAAMEDEAERFLAEVAGTVARLRAKFAPPPEPLSSLPESVRLYGAG